MQVGDVPKDPADQFGSSPALSLALRQGEGVSLEAREEQERVVLGEREALMDQLQGGDLGKLVGEQGAEPCRHLVSYMRKVRKVGRDLRIVCRVPRVRGNRRTGRHAARII